jgi:hypothetical protein
MSNDYTIKIDKNIKNFAEALRVILGELSRIHCYYKDRPVVELHVGGYSTQNIARLLNISRQNVYDTLVRNSQLLPPSSSPAPLTTKSALPGEGDGGSSESEAKNSNGKESNV